MRRVLMICYYFPPLGGIGSLRALKFATYLPEFGWEPTVVTPRRGTYYRDPTLSFPEANVIRTASLELSRWGKRVLTPGSNDTTAAVVGVWTKLFRDVARRWLYRPDPQVGWYPFGVRAGRAALGERKHDVVFSSSFPITAHRIAQRLHRDCGVPWVAEFRDPWSDEVHDSDPRKGSFAKMERSIVREAGLVVLPSPAWADLFREKGARALAVVTNGFDPSDIPQAPQAEGFVLSHLGSFYPDRQDLSSVWIALARLRSAERLPRLRLRFIGSLHPVVEQEIGQCGLLDAVEVSGFLPYREALREMTASKALLVAGSRDERPWLKGFIPAKVFEYLGSGLPILYVGNPETDAARLLGNQPGCFVVSPGDVEAIEQALCRMAAMGRVARDVEAFTRRALAKELANVLDRACR